MKKVRSVAGIRDAYSRRILTKVIGKDPVEVLAATPGRLKSLLNGLNGRQLRKPRAKGKWSIAQLVSHLSDAEVVLAFRLRMAVAQSGSFLQAMDEQKWAEGLDYKKANVKKKLELFTAMRKDHLALLKSLGPTKRQRFGRHEERGKETVERMAQMYAGHDINHLRQIEMIRRSLRRRSGR
jgi:hypothetical protein